MKQAHDLIVKNFKKVEQAIFPLVNEKKQLSLLLDQFPGEKTALLKCGTLIMRFERVLEIVCNIFFRAVETAEFGALSTDTAGCISKMKELSLISSEELWVRMILSRSALSASPKQEEWLKFCREINSLFIDELEYFCSSVKARYNIPV